MKCRKGPDSAIVSGANENDDKNTTDVDNISDTSVFKLVKIDTAKTRRRPLLKSELDFVSRSRSESELESDDSGSDSETSNTSDGDSEIIMRPNTNHLKDYLKAKYQSDEVRL